MGAANNNIIKLKKKTRHDNCRIIIIDIIAAIKCIIITWSTTYSRRKHESMHLH